MIEDRLEQMQSAIEQSPKISGDTKAELLALVAGLRAEIKTLSETHHEEATSITRFADEAARARENPHGGETALDSLRGSIQGFEDSHPKLVETVNRFATALSNMGL